MSARRLRTQPLADRRVRQPLGVGRVLPGHLLGRAVTAERILIPLIVLNLVVLVVEALFNVAGALFGF